MANARLNGRGTRPPDGRRAGCPHPAAPRGGARFRFLKFPRCGGRERPPYGPGQHGGLPGNRRPCAVTNPCRGGFHIRPVRGKARFRGRDKSLPYEPRQARGQPGKTRPRVITNPCRGRCLHCARRRVSEANRAIGPALRPEIVPQTPQRGKVPREGYGPPLQTMANTRPNGAAPGRCFHSGRGRAYLWCCCNRECQNGYSAPCSASRPCSPVRILTAFSTS